MKEVGMRGAWNRVVSKRRLPSPAMVIAMVALLIGLGGTASATGLLGPCGYLVCAGDIGTGAVDSRVVKDRSLGLKEWQPGAIAALRSLPDFKAVTFQTASRTANPNTNTAVTVNCPSGQIALGGGGTTAVGPNGEYGDITDSYPSDSTGAPGTTAWTVFFDNLTTAALTINAYVSCAPAG